MKNIFSFLCIMICSCSISQYEGSEENTDLKDMNRDYSYPAPKDITKNSGTAISRGPRNPVSDPPLNDESDDINIPGTWAHTASVLMGQSLPAFVRPPKPEPGDK